MPHKSGMQLNKLSYDPEREIVEFSMRRSMEDTAIMIDAEVPLVIIDQAGLRQAAKEAVRQALLDAVSALEDSSEDPD